MSALLGMVYVRVHVCVCLCFCVCEGRACVYFLQCVCAFMLYLCVCVCARACVCVCVYVLSSIAQQAAMIAALKSAYDSETAALKESYQVVLPSLCGRVFYSNAR